MAAAALAMSASRCETDAVKLPLKNTFVHFDDARSPIGLPPRQAVSCPFAVQTRQFRTKASLQEHLAKKLRLHSERQCRPCAFFAYKADGCRQGDACEYCHLCTRTEIRRWKRVKAKYASRSSDSAESTCDDADVQGSQSSCSSEAGDSASFPTFRPSSKPVTGNVKKPLFVHPAKRLLGMQAKAT
eukprot:TRINITY_DN12770_c0_g3_i1.p1 TRINITY_DN12770_c0_g3~~TRINITY_DN12770_c0_g3_i1.p1  ORF type:complete len:205 (-),score=39.71 TRINITY_DN12770_c0_g3_i1:607-1164(-)